MAGDKFISLCEAVAWIASEGGAKPVHGVEAVGKDKQPTGAAIQTWARWDAAERDLLEKLKTGELVALGLLGGRGTPTEIPQGDFTGAVCDRQHNEPFLSIAP